MASKFIFFVLTALNAGGFLCAIGQNTLHEPWYVWYVEERNVLLEIYNSTDGNHWIKKNNWTPEDRSQLSDHCQWYGVHCEQGTDKTPQHIIEILLPANNLSGSLPRTLWKLTELRNLSVRSNQGLGGKLKDFIYSNMTNLKIIDLSFCSFSGVLPEAMMSLNNLRELRICCQRGRDKINGTIPEAIGNLSSLEVLSLGENSGMTGPVPETIANLTNLKVLDLEGMCINSSAESVFKNLTPQLRSLNLSYTRISGELPRDFGKRFEKLEELLLPGNELTGDIPASLGSMGNLQRISLANNKISGITLPNKTNLANLTFVDLSHNDLELGNFSSFHLSSIQLQILLLSENVNLNVSLEMFLKTQVNSFRSLNVLNISRCDFQGRIPPLLWSFKSLIYVDFSKNKLSGRLPEMETSMFSFLYFDVSGNDLEGPIPSTFSRFHSLNYLDISANGGMHSLTNGSEFDRDLGFLNINYKDVQIRNGTTDGENITCPNALLQVNHGRVLLDPKYYNFAFCTCASGDYGHSNKCNKCMDGGHCDGSKLMTIKKGYWPEPGPENVTSLTPCISDSSFFDHSATCSPSGQCTCHLNITTNATSCVDDCLCGRGSFDRLCSRCYKRWYKSGNICLKCPSHHHASYVFTGVLFITLIIFFVSLFYLRNHPMLGMFTVYGQITILLFLRVFNVIPGWIFEINFVVLVFYLAGLGQSTKGLLKIAIFYFQILDAMISNYKLWPKVVLEGQHYLSSLVNFHFPGLSCDIPDLYTPIGQFAFLIVFPIFCISIVWVFYCVSRTAHDHWSRFNHWDLLSVKCHCLHITIVCLNLTYFPIVLRSIAVLAGCTNQKYMRLAPWVSCSSSTSHTLNLLGWLSTVVYMVGVPLFVFLPLLLRYVREKKRASLTMREQEILDRWLGTIYLPYKKQYRSFLEVYSILRKLLLAFMIGYIPDGSSMQTFSVSLVLTIALIIHLVLQPYRSSLGWIPAENIMETIVLVVLQHSFVLLRFTTIEPARKASLLWVIIEANGVVVVFLFVIISYLIGKRTVKTLKNRTKTKQRNKHLTEPLLEQGADEDSE